MMGDRALGWEGRRRVGAKSTGGIARLALEIPRGASE